MKRTPLRRVSKKRAKLNKEYTEKRRDFLYLRPLCEIWVELQNAREISIPLLTEIYGQRDHNRPVYSEDVHHKAGRTGGNFLDDSTWMALSRQAHEWVHKHPKDARALGWLK